MKQQGLYNTVYFYTFLIFCVLIASCVHLQENTRSFTILSINDSYRIEGVDEGKSGGLARVRSLRMKLEKVYPDLLFLHAGDFLYPSLLSRQYQGRQMIDVLNRMDGKPEVYDNQMFVTFGNHEFEKVKMNDAIDLENRIGESEFLWLGSNIRFSKDLSGDPVVESPNLQTLQIVESGGVKVGIFSLTTNMKHPSYVDEFENPIEVAWKMTQELRKGGAEFIVALTHQSIPEDSELLNSLGRDGPDLVIGGHEHSKQSQEVNGRWILKADADVRTATVVRVTFSPRGTADVRWEFRELTAENVSSDPVVQERVDWWINKHDRDYCEHELKLQSGCLKDVLGKSQVTLKGEEIEIRKYETNLGNWVADQAVEAFTDAQIAFVNSGSLRLNQDIPAGAAITRRHIEQLFAFPAPLVQFEIDGKTLEDVIKHAVENWVGTGWWLQISGFAFNYDPNDGTVSSLTLLSSDGTRRLIQPEDTLSIVTYCFLASGGDGYDMLGTLNVKCSDQAPDLKEIVINKFRAESKNGRGIAPQIEGRICNSLRKGPCLAKVS